MSLGGRVSRFKDRKPKARTWPLYLRSACAPVFLPLVLGALFAHGAQDAAEQIGGAARVGHCRQLVLYGHVLRYRHPLSHRAPLYAASFFSHASAASRMIQRRVPITRV